MDRTLRLSAAFGTARHRFSRPRTPSGLALAATLARLTSQELPGPGDYQVMVPPMVRAWVRRVPGFNLWVFYRFTDQVVMVLTASNSPPVPLDE